MSKLFMFILGSIFISCSIFQVVLAKKKVVLDYEKDLLI